MDKNIILKKKEKKNHPTAQAAVRAWRDRGEYPADVTGAYTGVGLDEKPEQDADDL